MADRLTTPRGGGAWTKVAIFISLYVLLLQSLVEWVLVLYLYGNKHVDSKMAPSLILSLIASFFTIPLVGLHSFLAWQYNRVLGYGCQKAMLSTGCTYMLRLTIIIWLAASVAGLVVVSQQASCLPDSAVGSFWKVGVSCALHRAAVIVSVLSFLTVCLYFCSRELCERPYDVSLLGVYKPQRAARDNSIFSSSSLDSERSLKNDILCVCRRPDVTYGRTPYMSSSEITEKSEYIPSIQQPTPIRPTSFLQLSADQDYEIKEHLSGATISSYEAIPGLQPSPHSPTFTALRPVHQDYGNTLPELPGGPDLERKSNHTRQKSSVSSLRRFLPKGPLVSAPLSADPQIMALADPTTPTPMGMKTQDRKEKHVLDKSQSLGPQVKLPKQTPENVQLSHVPTSIPQASTSLPRSVTMNSAEAPEVVPPAPLKVRRSNTSQTAPLPRTKRHPHRTPSYPRSAATGPATSSWATLLDTNRPTRISTMRIPRQSQFEPDHVPRYTQSHRYPRNRHSRPGVHRNMSSLGRRNDVGVLYPSTRRSRSSTFGGIAPFPGHLDSIRETGASIDEAPSGDTYRGANRTNK